MFPHPLKVIMTSFLYIRYNFLQMENYKIKERATNGPPKYKEGYYQLAQDQLAQKYRVNTTKHIK